MKGLMISILASFWTELVQFIRQFYAWRCCESPSLSRVAVFKICNLLICVKGGHTSLDANWRWTIPISFLRQFCNFNNLHFDKPWLPLMQIWKITNCIHTHYFILCALLIFWNLIIAWLPKWTNMCFFYAFKI